MFLFYHEKWIIKPEMWYKSSLVHFYRNNIVDRNNNFDYLFPAFLINSKEIESSSSLVNQQYVINVVWNYKLSNVTNIENFHDHVNGISTEYFKVSLHTILSNQINVKYVRFYSLCLLCFISTVKPQRIQSLIYTNTSLNVCEEDLMSSDKSK